MVMSRNHRRLDPRRWALTRRAMFDRDSRRLWAMRARRLSEARGWPVRAIRLPGSEGSASARGARRLRPARQGPIPV